MAPRSDVASSAPHQMVLLFSCPLILALLCLPLQSLSSSAISFSYQMSTWIMAEPDYVQILVPGSPGDAVYRSVLLEHILPLFLMAV